MIVLFFLFVCVPIHGCLYYIVKKALKKHQNKSDKWWYVALIFVYIIITPLLYHKKGLY